MGRGGKQVSKVSERARRQWAADRALRPPSAAEEVSTTETSRRIAGLNWMSSNAWRARASEISPRRRPRRSRTRPWGCGVARWRAGRG